MELIKLQTFGTVITQVMEEGRFPNDVLEHSVVVFEVERDWFEKHITDVSIDEYLQSYDWSSSEWLFTISLAANELKTISFTYHHL
ncbi:hypothetical protein [Brevibacillus agri]|uniref:hypothetical protein n=1 Tax=Brevibacillus agri TaxID=51101 RepID=UPI0018CFC508|nr:hypothetical protein [Brevibacillus agri]MBG9568415.1 hypothetical protein [Brevibacillus agri]